MTSTDTDRLVISRGRLVTLAAAVMIVVQLAFRAWAVLGSWYRYDDANFMAKLLADGLSPYLMFHGYAGHLMPAAFGLTAFNFSLDPYAWTYPATELLVLQALADVGAVVFLVSAFGRRLGILPPLAVFLFGSLTLPAMLTWGPGITQLPFLAAIFWGGWANLAYLRTRRVRWALLTMLITLVAIVFGEKSVLLFWTYAVVAVCWFTSGDLLTRLRTLVTRYLPGVVLYTLVAAAAVAAYLVLGPGSNSVGGTTAGASLFTDVTQRLLFDSWAPGIIGGPLGWTWVDGSSAGLATPGIVVSVASVALLAALTWEICRTRTHAARAWWLVGGILAADIVLITVARAVAAGPDLALAFRYLTETGAVGAMALALATMPLRGAVDSVDTRRTSPFLDAPRRVVGVTAVVAALGLFSSFSYVQTWLQDDKTKQYVDTVRADLAGSKEPVPLVDGPVPQWMVWGAAYPDNLVSHVLAPLHAKTSFPQVSTNNLDTVDDAGHIRPVDVQAVRHALAGPESSKACPNPVSGGAVQVTLDGPVVGEGWWIKVSYRAQAAGHMHVVAGEIAVDVPVEPGFHSLFLRTQGGEFADVFFSRVSTGSMTCVGGITVGHVAAFGPPISRSGSGSGSGS